MKKRVWITGEDGMIGSRLVSALQATDDFEVILAKDDLDLMPILSRCELDLCRTANEMDICSPDIDEFLDLANPDIVINCAGIVNTVLCEREYWRASQVNEAGVYNLVQALNDYNIWRQNPVRLMHFSTTAIYNPKDGRYEGKIHEGTIKEPNTFYGITKLGGEYSVEFYYPPKLQMIVRPCFIYDYPSHSKVSDMVQWLKNDLIGSGGVVVKDRFINLDPRYKKDYMYVTDFIDIILRLLRTSDGVGAWGTDFNISLGQPTPFEEIIKIFETLGLARNRYILHPEKDYMGDHLVAGQKTRIYFPDWKPKISIREGIELMLNDAGISL